MRKSDSYDQFVCPACYGKLADEVRFLACESCGRRYPIDEHGFAHLLISEGDKHRLAKDR